VSLVESFQEGLNQHDVDKVMSMFAEDAEFEILGVSKYSGKEQIKNVFEYDVGVNTELKYISSIFVFSDRRIQSFISEIPPEVVQYNREVWQKFIPWLSKNYPAEYSRMLTSNGRFIYNRENGRDVVALLKRWRGVNDK
jgi:Txe/YoeB family toxin of Txe-Axe toxin-antitoxin module